MKFSDVIGQDEVKQRLLNMSTSGKVPHAIMFAGPEGSGSLAIALAFAQYIQCENKLESDSCGSCETCVKNQKFIHPDVHFTFPVVTKKSGEPPISNDYINEWRAAIETNPYLSINDWLQSIEAENRQGNITVRECHEIIKSISLKTYESGYKIHIIWLAEFLKEAGNTLLKVIEEPPVDTIFILVTENIELILNTILSRTQIIKINPILDIDIQQGLLQRFQTDEKSALRIARVSDGNFNMALIYSEGSENKNDKLLHRWLVFCFNLKQKNSPDNTANLFDWVEEISKIGRENQKLFLKYALFFLHECTLIAITGVSEKLEGEEFKFAKGLSSKLEIFQLESITHILNKLHYSIERNGNPKVLFLSNSFKIADIFNRKTAATD